MCQTMDWIGVATRQEEEDNNYVSITKYIKRLYNV